MDPDVRQMFESFFTVLDIDRASVSNESPSHSHKPHVDVTDLKRPAAIAAVTEAKKPTASAAVPENAVLEATDDKPKRAPRKVVAKNDADDVKVAPKKLQ